MLWRAGFEARPAAHDNHFHVDLTPGSDYISFTDNYFIGPAPYWD